MKSMRFFGLGITFITSTIIGMGYNRPTQTYGLPYEAVSRFGTPTSLSSSQIPDLEMGNYQESDRLGVIIDNTHVMLAQAIRKEVPTVSLDLHLKKQVALLQQKSEVSYKAVIDYLAQSQTLANEDLRNAVVPLLHELVRDAERMETEEKVKSAVSFAKTKYICLGVLIGIVGTAVVAFHMCHHSK